MASLKTPVVYLHTHWDREWYQSFRMYQVRLAEVVDAILDRLESGIFPCFMLDGQTVLLDDYLELRPERKTQLEKLIHSGTLRIGPWYVMPDEFLVSGESLIRNLKHGILSSKAYGQADSFCGYLPDTFGHSADIPTVLSQFGIHNAIVWRGVNPKTAEFMWESPSGDQVLGYYLADGYFQMMMHQYDSDPDLAEIGKQGALNRLIDKLSNRASLQEYLVPIGGDHLGPLDKDGMSRLQEYLPNLKIETPERFIERVNPQNIKTKIAGELTNNDEAFLLPGVYSSRVYLKKSNRILEHALARKWEPLQAMALVLSKEVLYPNELQTAWKTLLLNHPHDSICGCSVDSVHQHNEVRFEEVKNLYDGITPRLQNKLVQSLEQPASKSKSEKSQDCYLVLNTLERPFSGVVSVEADASEKLPQSNGKITILEDGYMTDFMQVPLSHKKIERQTGWVWVDDIPSLGIQSVDKKKIKKLPENKYAKLVDKQTIENNLLVLTVDPAGVISVQVKQTGIQYIGLHQFRDIAHQGDSYNTAPVPGAPVGQAVLKKAKPWQKGPLVAGLWLTYQIGKWQIETRVWLEADNPQVFFETTYENHAPDHCLQVGFDTGNPIFTVMAESHFSMVERTYDPNYDITQYMPAAAWKELKTNTGPIQRFVTTNDQAFFTEGISEYEVAGSKLYLTLLRAFGAISSPDTGVRGAQAGPPFETPEGQCIHREISLCYAWMPVADKTFSDLACDATRFLGNTMASAVQAVPGISRSLFAWDNPSVLYTACYPASNGDIVLRLLNYSQEQQQLRFSGNAFFNAYYLANGLDESTGQSISIEQPLGFKPFELRTLRFQPMV